MRRILMPDNEKINKLEIFCMEHNISFNDLIGYIKYSLSDGTNMFTRKTSLVKTKLDEAYLWYNSNIE